MFLIFCLYHHVCIWWPLRHWKNRLVYDLQNMSNISWKEERNLVGENWKVYDHLFIQYHKYFFLVCKRINSQYENVQIHIYMLHIHTSYLGASWWTITSACCIFILLKNPIHAHRCSWEFLSEFQVQLQRIFWQNTHWCYRSCCKDVVRPWVGWVGLNKMESKGEWEMRHNGWKDQDEKRGWYLYHLSLSLSRNKGRKQLQSDMIESSIQNLLHCWKKNGVHRIRDAPTLCLTMCHVPWPASWPSGHSLHMGMS